ncbi:MAG: four helix bundle protein [Prevotella sp.]|jgi:four helix bundle protein
MTRDFRDIYAWQKAHQFVLMVYKAVKGFPEEEKFGLRSQFTRAAVSIPANIAEGYRKLGKADKLRFLNISQGSLEECRYYIILSRDLGYIDENLYYQLCESVEEASRLINKYCKGILENNGYKAD